MSAITMHAPILIAPVPRELWLRNGFDLWLFFSAALLLALGLIMVASASMPMADRQNGQPFYYLYRQLGFAGLGIALGVFAFRVPVDDWYHHSPKLLIAAIIMLVAVLVPGVGKEVNGSVRWVRMGPVNVQVSEIAKLFLLIYVAGYLRRFGDELRKSTLAMVRPMLILALVALLLLMEPDFGAAVVIMATAFGMLFMAGVSIWRFAAMQLLTLAAMSVVLYTSPYRRARLASFMDPWADPFNAGFQLVQSLIAVGRGELFGVGLGASVQKLFYLPEAHTDFLFAVLAEETGLLGIAVLMVLYAVLIGRAFAIGACADRLRQRFNAALAYGIGLWFALQALINMGVNMGALPTKGLTLPLMSYGGSSLVVMSVSLAILLRVGAESRVAELALAREQSGVRL